MANQDLPPSYDASQSWNQTLVNPPPYHNWQEAVPDTATFPPPPIAGYLISGTGNASEDDAQRAHDFCNSVPLWLPTQPSPAVYNDVQAHDLRPVQPAELRGHVSAVARGRWRGHSVDGNRDCVILTQLPMYFPAADSPFVREQKKIIYFEVKLLALRAGPTPQDCSGISIGFAAQPYPSWRSPGWERGGLGVFSDDGCRFVNDSFGGRDFTTAFKVGETVGLGMEFELPDNICGEKNKRCKVHIFFTRNGCRSGGWDLHEEVDADSGGVEGLEGDYDLYGAIGLFGGVDFESCFEPADWLWKE
ncbi:hypothetical protein N7491_008149 [Penicillium cf. griseofulvum]|uniref:SPRY domain-containing protein n=1 Tax=Penicillium cf. griseofulvum TaxID=2972120 RepID=A0A9W9J532_9EURO|nr:hypothetical protein N7472_008821 [Penicillium cf. griseofulvum]KAJ5427707.1 hypothetical protein N7491_008149 [Penicillium cf. griseofulvum]KAJ5431906.1 hypothetical protein N7445_008404 [Penicillium cf. griseofulvum]